MIYEMICVEYEGDVVVFIFNDLVMFNVMGLQMVVEICEVIWDLLNFEFKVCCFLIIGEGCVFCLGVNFFGIGGGDFFV